MTINFNLIIINIFFSNSTDLCWTWNESLQYMQHNNINQPSSPFCHSVKQPPQLLKHLLILMWCDISSLTFFFHCIILHVLCLSLPLMMMRWSCWLLLLPLPSLPLLLVIADVYCGFSLIGNWAAIRSGKRNRWRYIKYIPLKWSERESKNKNW